jgi:hypothetical protein
LLSSLLYYSDKPQRSPKEALQSGARAPPPDAAGAIPRRCTNQLVKRHAGGGVAGGRGVVRGVAGGGFACVAGGGVACVAGCFAGVAGGGGGVAGGCCVVAAAGAATASAAGGGGGSARRGSLCIGGHQCVLPSGAL